MFQYRSLPGSAKSSGNNCLVLAWHIRCRGVRGLDDLIMKLGAIVGPDIAVWVSGIELVGGKPVGAGLVEAFDDVAHMRCIVGVAQRGKFVVGWPGRKRAGRAVGVSRGGGVTVGQLLELSLHRVAHAGGLLRLR